ncbi:hypothetical protein PR002_g7285 [Phytophthora rubi]|uniref:Uncharacterized protein n=1 Tax=Phytophthora rubi TaxID=129364 RepID=A0A6A3MX89_9STRA|nr:hypothetical protein PR002_g7285 [Phytophthora rubi]
MIFTMGDARRLVYGYVIFRQLVTGTGQPRSSNSSKRLLTADSTPCGLERYRYRLRSELEASERCIMGWTQGGGALHSFWLGRNGGVMDAVAADK